LIIFYFGLLEIKLLKSFVYSFRCGHSFHFCGINAWENLLDYMENFFINETSKLIFHSVCTFLHLYQKCMRDPAAHILLSIWNVALFFSLSLSAFLCLSYVGPVGLQWFPIVVLICSFLMTSYVENLHMCLFAIWILSRFLFLLWNCMISIFWIQVFIKYYHT
jgi:hypothetical protein